ncbi:MAG: FAD-binding protein [Hyphomicrobiales bacterium]
MTTLLIGEHHNTAIRDATKRTLSAAKELGDEVHVLIAGYDCGAAAGEAAKLAGVTTVLKCDDAMFAYPLAEPVAALVLGLADEYDAIMAAASASGKNVMPRIAALLDVMQISDITVVKSATTFERPIYAGNAIQTVETDEPKKVITVRVSAFAAAGNGGSAAIKTVAAPQNPAMSEHVEESLTPSDRPDLASAPIVISGGRGLRSQQNFQLLEKIADRLNAAIGASRAAVDAGFIANDRQVGQTGVAVSPELYIAVGISGAIQHLAGMKDSKIIVAINKDAEAPIFKVADYGLVADLFEAIPELDRELARLGY